MTEIAFASARVLADRLRRRQLSSLELVDHFLARIERHNPKVNAVVTLDPERARNEAKRADDALARRKQVGPLHGIPMTLKDALEVSDMRTTAGAKIWKDHVSSHDAVAVQRLRAAGAIILGKTNTPAFSADLQSYNAMFGTTNNPWDLARTPGGSSGGAAAALASGMTPVELGSDVAGSIRTPAGFCGVYGHKPSHGLVPMRGHMPGPSGTLAEPDLVVIGPMTNHAEDLALLLDVVAGPLPEKARAYQLSLPAPRSASLRGYRVACWLNDTAFPVEASVLARLEDTVAGLRRAGVRVDEAHPEFELENVYKVYRSLLDPMMIAGVGPKIVKQLEEQALQDPTDAGTVFAKNALISHREWLTWNEFREHIRAAFARFFLDYDVLLCPITMLPAFAHDHSEPQTRRKLLVNGQARAYPDMFAWVSLATVALLPATAAPIGRTPEGLPVGVQIIGPYLEDRTPIDFAGRLADLLGGFEPPPGF
jgi:amidase